MPELTNQSSFRQKVDLSVLLVAHWMIYFHFLFVSIYALLTFSLLIPLVFYMLYFQLFIKRKAFYANCCLTPTTECTYVDVKQLLRHTLWFDYIYNNGFRSDLVQVRLIFTGWSQTSFIIVTDFSRTQELLLHSTPPSTYLNA